MALTQDVNLLQHLRKLVMAQHPSQEADRQLLQQFIADADEAAFAGLVQRHGAMVLGVCRSVLRHQQDAEDALQDTFMRAYIGLQQFEGRSSVYSWLTRIAINSALMILRRRRVRAEVVFDSPADELGATGSLEVRDTALNPEQILARQQRWIHMLEAIEKLDPKLRAPIRVLMTHECSMNEIARALDISVPAVKARLHRARRRLSTRLMRRSQRIMISHPA